VCAADLEADEKNDLRSTDRKLQQRLVLLVKQKLGNGQHWVLPMGQHCNGESMRQVLAISRNTLAA
jgi:large subunit ribosomal protein L46